MSLYSYLPNSLSDPTFLERSKPGGVYKCLSRTFAGMGPAALVNAEPIKITNSTKTKCTIVLACPTRASPVIKNLFYNQICILDGIREADRVEEIRSGTNVDVKEIVKSLQSGGEADAIVLTGEPLHTVLKKNSSRETFGNHCNPVIAKKPQLIKCGLDVDNCTAQSVTSDLLDLPEVITKPHLAPVLPEGVSPPYIVYLTLILWQSTKFTWVLSMIIG
ncbi:hypothetical protein EV368DRAFT_90321 [Lentinula lateritia]|nr:hypothetical protein EV368DRAFT_90321 [Lentinula lateritia]